MARTAPGADVENLTNTQKQQTVASNGVNVAHAADVSTYSRIIFQYDFATSLQLMTTEKGGSAFVPTLQGGEVLIGKEADISVESITFVRTAIGDIGTAVQVYAKSTGVPAEGFGSDKQIFRFVADFTGDIPSSGRKVFNFGPNPEGLIVYHDTDPTGDDATTVQINGDGLLTTRSNAQGYVMSFEGRAIPLSSDAGSAGVNKVYMALNGSSMIFVAASGANVSVTTGDLLQAGSVYGGAAVVGYFDPATGQMYHNVAFISTQTFTIQFYGDVNRMFTVPYIADTTGLVNIYSTGNMGQPDALAATFADTEDHDWYFSNTLTPMQNVKAA